MPFLSANSYLGIIKEASGTPGTLPTSGSPSWIPVSTPQITPQQMFLRDEAFRGSPTTVYDQVAGVRHDEVEFKSFLFADTFPVLAQSILGGADSISGTTSITHTMKVLNSASTGSQPPTYSILDFDGANYFTTTGAQADSLAISFGAEAAAEATIKYLANPYTSYTTAPTVFATNAPTTQHMIPAWNTTVSIGGTTYLNVTTGDITINRKTQAIYTLGQQTPYDLFAGPIEVTGKFTLVVATNADTFTTPSTFTNSTPPTVSSSAFGLSRSPQAVVITLTDPNDLHNSVADSVAFTMTTAQFHNVKRTRGKEFTEIEVEFTANANQTDSATGYSPIKVVTINGVTGAY